MKFLLRGNRFLDRPATNTRRGVPDKKLYRISATRIFIGLRLLVSGAWILVASLATTGVYASSGPKSRDLPLLEVVNPSRPFSIQIDGVDYPPFLVFDQPTGNKVPMMAGQPLIREVSPTLESRLISDPTKATQLMTDENYEQREIKNALVVSEGHEITLTGLAKIDPHGNHLLLIANYYPKILVRVDGKERFPSRHYDHWIAVELRGTQSISVQSESGDFLLPMFFVSHYPDLLDSGRDLQSPEKTLLSFIDEDFDLEDGEEGTYDLPPYWWTNMCWGRIFSYAGIGCAIKYPIGAFLWAWPHPEDPPQMNEDNIGYLASSWDCKKSELFGTCFVAGDTGQRPYMVNNRNAKVYTDTFSVEGVWWVYVSFDYMIAELSDDADFFEWGYRVNGVDYPVQTNITTETTDDWCSQSALCSLDPWFGTYGNMINTGGWGPVAVSIYFRFDSNGSAESSGVYIDNVNIYYDQAPPTVTTNPAQAITQTSAELRATVNPNGPDTTVKFQYGTSPSLGSTATVSTVYWGFFPYPVKKTVANLQCGTTYHFRVSATNEGGGTSTGEILDFETDPCPCEYPATPTISVPASAVSGANYTVSWTPTSPDNEYLIQEANGPLFSNPTQLTVNGTTRTFSHNVTSTSAYYYRVRAIDNCNGQDYPSEWSDDDYIIVNPECTDPPAPSLSAPATATSGSSYSVTWSPTSPDNEYLIQESTNEGFNNPTQFTVSGTIRTFSHNVSSSTPYFYQVRAVDDCGGEDYHSEWSNADSTVVAPQDLPQITIQAIDSSAAEPSNPGTFRIRRNVATENPLTVNFGIGGTASIGSDYQTFATSTTILAGQDYRDVVISPINDALVESTETVILTLSTNPAYTIGSPSSATVSIADDDLPQVTLEATDSSAAEPSNPGTFRIRRNVATENPLTVNFGIGGTASIGSDYQTFATSTTILAGQDYRDVVINPINDSLVESTETVILTLSTNPAYTIGSPSSATVSIADDDLPQVTVEATDESAAEPSNPGTFRIRRNVATENPLTVNFGISGTASIGTDYQTFATSTTILAGQDYRDVVINPINDSLVESTETVILTLSTNAAYTIGSPSSATVSIADDDLPQVTVEAADESAAEPSNPGILRIFRTGPTSSSLTVYFVVGGTAIDGTDYQSISTSAVISAGQNHRDITINPIDDSLMEGTETVILTLFTSPAYSIGTLAAATVNIADDDVAEVTIEATDSSAGEPSNPGMFRISRTGPTSSPLTVYYAVGGTAISGTDYETITTSTTILAGQVYRYILISPNNDSLIEGTETVVLSITPNATYTIGSPSSATVSIADDDVAEVTIQATESSAGEPANPGTFRISRTGPTASAMTVYYSVGGTATNGSDYNTLGTSTTISAGQSYRDIVISPINDSLIEGTETVVLSIISNAAYSIGSPSSATVSIADDDVAEVTIQATESSAGEPTNPGTFRISRTGPTASAMTVYYSVGGTATNGSDYNTLGTSTTISAGQPYRDIVITPINDSLIEGTETVVMTLTANAAYSIGSPSSATVSIADDDVAEVTIQATESSAGEPSNPGTFRISRTGPTPSAMTVYYSIGGTATNGSDYNTLGTSTTISAGQSYRDIVISPINDSLIEGTETVVMTLTANAAYSIGSPGSATVSIADDDIAEVTVQATDSSAAEPSNPGTFRISRTGPTASAMTVYYSIGGTATNGSDYNTLSTSTTISAGQPYRDIVITPINDSLIEGTETVVMTLTANAAYSIGSPGSATVSIADDDIAEVTVQATDSSAAEPSNPGTFRISRTGPTANPMTVYYSIGGTATNGSDYNTLSTSTTISAGQSYRDIVISPINDSLIEGTETVVMTLTANAAYSIGSPGSATVSIADDDIAEVTVQATDSSAGEPSNSGTFRISRTGPTASAMTVYYSIGGTATNGSDYNTLSNSTTISAGQSYRDIVISPINDSLIEGTETVIMTLAANAAYSIGSPASATVSIADDEVAEVTVQATDSSAAEPSNPGTFRISRTGPTASAMTVYYSIGGTATNGSDYNTLSTSTTISAGQSYRDVVISPINDSLIEGTETVVMTLTANAAYAIGSPSSATVSIADDDIAEVTVQATDSSAGEPSNPGTFRISRTGPTDNAMTVYYSIGGTATNGSDYNTLSTSTTISAGQSYRDVVISPINDSLIEGTETVVLALTANAAYSIGSPGSATVSLSDDDAAEVTVQATDSSAAEPSNTGTFRISRTGPTASAMTVYYSIGGTATNGSDYNTLSTSTTISAGQSYRDVVISPINDSLIEGTETVVLALTANAAYSIGSPGSATVSLSDDDAAEVTVQATDSSAGEPANDGMFRISRTGPTSSPMTVTYSVGGTATNGSDYNFLSSSTTISAGQNHRDITINPIDDSLIEGAETVVLSIAPNAAYSIGLPSSATVSIADDDQADLTSLTIGGPDTVPQQTGTQYTATASWSDGTTTDVSASAIWSEDSPYASITTGGIFITSDVPADQTATITASYASGSGVTRSDTHTVTITALVPIITAINITGPSEVDEGESAQFTATATWDNGSSTDVTNGTTWTESSPYASISNTGLLITSEVPDDELFTITATFTSGAGHTRVDTHAVTIRDSQNPATPIFEDGFEDGNCGSWSTIVGFVAPNECLSETHDLNDNMVPSGWTLDVNRNGEIAGGRLWAHTDNSDAKLSRNIGSPGDTSTLRFAYDGNMASSYYGHVNGIQLHFADGTQYAVYHRTSDHLAESQSCLRFYVPLDEDRVSVSWECIPKIEGEFHHAFLIENGQIRFKVDRLDNGETVFDGTHAMSGLEPSSITRVGFMVYATEDEDVWVDNLEFKVCP